VTPIPGALIAAARLLIAGGSEQCMNALIRLCAAVRRAHMYMLRAVCCVLCVVRRAHTPCVSVASCAHACARAFVLLIVTSGLTGGGERRNLTGHAGDKLRVRRIETEIPRRESRNMPSFKIGV
jgi:hypothetical protein